MPASPDMSHSRPFASAPARMSACCARRVAYSLLCCLLLGGCAVGPDYLRPELAPPDSYKEEQASYTSEADWRPAVPGTPDTGPWWRAFQDETLNTLMDEVATANQNVQAALASLRQARAQVREARASFFPVVGGSSTINRGVSTPGKAVDNSYTARLQASWELDIWGGTRRSVESSSAQAQAKAADLGAVLLSMRAELALNYFQLRTYDTLGQLYTETVHAYTRSLEITNNQYEAGVVTRADLAQAMAQLKAAQAQAVDIELSRRQTEHAIATLLGRPPAELQLPTAPLAAHLPVIDAGLPAALVERRPDVAAAEQRVAAANASIGVAKSAYFPIFSFAASGGYVGTSFDRWFITPNEIWSLGPSLAMTLFQGGARIAKTDQAVAAWESAAAAYRQTVLQAFKEVEDALAASRLLTDEQNLQKEALAAAREAELLLLNQYKAGTVNFVSVVTAQASALTNARTVVQIEGRRFAAAVALIRALGGGWDASWLDADGTALPGTDNGQADGSRKASAME